MHIFYAFCVRFAPDPPGQNFAAMRQGRGHGSLGAVRPDFALPPMPYKFMDIYSVMGRQHSHTVTIDRCEQQSQARQGTVS
jgi:hypothetical protein